MGRFLKKGPKIGQAYCILQDFFTRSNTLSVIDNHRKKAYFAYSKEKFQ